jgi:hypothetical protein
MSALPADIATFTNDGILLHSDVAAGAQIAALHPNARDGSSSEIEMFFDQPDHAQIYLDEKFALVSQTNPPHIGVEIVDDIGFGEAIPIAPTVPCFTLLDEQRAQNVLARTRAYAHDTATDRFSLEMLV